MQAQFAKRLILGTLASCGYVVAKQTTDMARVRQLTGIGAAKRPTDMARVRQLTGIGAAKRLILHTLEQRGYVLLKRRDLDLQRQARERALLEAAEDAANQARAEAAARQAAEEASRQTAAEEASLQADLAADPSRIDLARRLCAVLADQGKPVPLELEESVLASDLETSPARHDLRERLETVRYWLKKLPPDRANERTLADFRMRNCAASELYIQITNECNLRCAMCAYKSATKDHSFMNEALFRRVLDQASAHKIQSVVFAAAYGEALLHPKAFQFLGESVARGFQVSVSTNGNFLSAEQIEELTSLGLQLIQYSFFGYDKPTYEKTYVDGNFHKASENLRLLKAALVKRGGATKLSVNGVNIVNDPERTDKTRKFLRTLGIEDGEMRLLVPCNFGGQISPGTRSQKVNAKSFKSVDQLPRYVCPLLLSTPGILADGRMTACGALDNNGSLAIGDIGTSTIAEMRSSKRYQAMIDAFITGDFSDIPLCAKCDIPYGNMFGEYNEPSA